MTIFDEIVLLKENLLDKFLSKNEILTEIIFFVKNSHFPSKFWPKNGQSIYIFG